MAARATVLFTPGRQILYASGSFAFTLLERMIILYVAFYYLPPRELAAPTLVTARPFWGVFTVLGLALLLGRLFDGLADPLVASLSDSSRSKIGRRKLFLSWSSIPLVCSAAAVFFPPHPQGESVFNGIWLAAAMTVFYICFTAYVNPYLALISELGRTEKLRLNLSMVIGLFGLLGIIAVTVLFPEAASRLQAGGLDWRAAYRVAAAGAAAFSLPALLLVTLSFDEREHCLPARLSTAGVWSSFARTIAVKPFRIFLLGEVFLQFAMNIVTLGMVYYAVVLFQRDQRFVIVLSALTIGVALPAIPLVNLLARKAGKKRVITAGMLLLAVATLAIFALSWNLSGAVYYVALVMFALAGLPLAILTTLINPTIAELAREDALKTGVHREAMFFGARAIPLKLSIALAGVVFGFLLSAFGKDIGREKLLASSTRRYYLQ